LIFPGFLFLYSLSLMRFSCLLALGLVSLSSCLYGQSGDKAGEVQNQPSAHLVIPPAPALSVEQALKSFTLAPGFKIEAVASEPLVREPVVSLIAEDGSIWVVEMRSFMPNVDGTGENEPTGTIAKLEDSDRDGKMDKRMEFAGGFVLPRALLLVGDGVLVGEPPHLWFLRDTNGDGKADEKTEVANDYGDTSNPEHTANSLTWGLDNWIYSANFTSRFRYKQGKWTREKTPFRGQWGLTQDDIGRLYFNNNSVPIQADAFPGEYLARNPQMPASQGLNRRLADPDFLKLFPGRVTTGINRGYKTLGEDGMLRSVTAACGPVIYRGALFPAEFNGNAFVCEPSANLIKRIVIDDTDSVLAARNAYEGSEFLTSTDERFRPVNLTNGPDGALYVTDLYRGVLQHRIYVTSYLRKQIESRNLETPIGLGRIYRIVPTDSKPAGRTRYPSQFTTAELVAALDNPNGWWRDTVQRLLVQRHDVGAIPALKAAAVNAALPALARLHALWTLHGLDGVDAPTLATAFGDSDVRVVATAARLSEPSLAKGDDASLEKVIAFTLRSESSLRLQAAFSLGASKSPAAEAALFKLARARGDQPYLNEAVVSSVPGREIQLIESLAAHPSTVGERVDASAIVATASATIVNGESADGQTKLFTWLDPRTTTPPWMRPAILAGIEQSIPKSSGNASRGVALAATPNGLLAFSRDSKTSASDAARAKKVLAALQWPGKPEPVVKVPAAIALTAAEKVLFEKGRKNFAICAGCHQPDGKGLNGLAPPLVNSQFVLGKSEILARIVLQGKENAPVLMPPLGALDDATIASILTYVRHSWGHAASAVTPESIAAVRAATKGRDEPWGVAELESLAR